MYSVFLNNQEVLKAKGDISYWAIANRLGVHENTIRNWMKSEMDLQQKRKVLMAIKEIKNGAGCEVV